MGRTPGAPSRPHVPPLAAVLRVDGEADGRAEHTSDQVRRLGEEPFALLAAHLDQRLVSLGVGRWCFADILCFISHFGLNLSSQKNPSNPCKPVLLVGLV